MSLGKPTALALLLVVSLAYLPPPPPLLWLGVSALFGLVLFLSSSLPGKMMMHISYQNRKLTPHKANGVSVMITEWSIYGLLIYHQYWPCNWAHQYYVDVLLICHTISLIVATFVFMAARLTFNVSRSANTFGNNMRGLWCGVEPSCKLLGYSIGQLQLDRAGWIFTFILSASIASEQYQREVYQEFKPPPSIYLGTPLLLYLLLLFIWAIDHTTWEIHRTYSHSFSKENIGWRSIWWKLCVLPFYLSYPIHSLTISSHHSLSPPLILVLLILFTIGYIMTRGTYSQSYYVKTSGPTAIIWGDRPIVVEFSKPSISNIQNNDKRLLVSGWWGIVRHPIHVGLSLMIFSLFSFSLLLHFTWSVLFLLIIGILYLWQSMREREQYRKEKYAAVWARYCHCVPYLVVPYIY